MRDPLECVVSDRPFTVRRVVRWADCDPAGVVYAGRYPEYLFDAVFRFIRHTGYSPDRKTGLPDSIGLPCKHMSLTFHASLYPDDVVNLEIYVAEVREHTFDLLVEARLSDGRLAFNGVFSPICINPDMRKRVPIPVGLREALQPHAARHEPQT